MTVTRQLIGDLLLRRDQAIRLAEKRAAGHQHPHGALTARERIGLLSDNGSFVQVDELTAGGIVAGHAAVDGRRIAIYAHDSTDAAGAVGEAEATTVGKVIRFALRVGSPVVGLVDSVGARADVTGLAGHAALTRSQAQASGVIPQVSVVLGVCAEEALLSVGLSDVTVAVASAGLPHADYRAADEADAIDWAQCLLSYLPDGVSAPRVACADDPVLDGLLPDSGAAYDMRGLLTRVVDDGELLELQSAVGPAMLCGFARLGGRPVGVVANQPLRAAGAIDADAAGKAARFVRLCDRFGVPVLTFADTAGPVATAWAARAAADLVAAYATARVPLLTVLVGRVDGSGYGVMGTRQLGAGLTLAWPTAGLAGGGSRTLYDAAERGYVDAVIPPSTTRGHLARALDLFTASP